MAFEIRNKVDASVAYYYEASVAQAFGGPWGDPNLFEHIQVTDRVNTEKSFGTKELLDTLIAKGVILKSDLPVEGQRIVD